MIFAFYLGIGFAFAILMLNAPPEITGPGEGGPWDSLSVPLLASTVLLMGLWVLGARVVFSLPLDVRANWVFRGMPFAAGPPCLQARRRALLAVSVTPALALSATVLLALAMEAGRRASRGSRLSRHHSGRVLVRRRSEDPVHLFLSTGKIQAPFHVLALVFPPSDGTHRRGRE
jgi:hypothetical protein